jgi:tRNA(Ile)-lysidine synthase
MDASIPVRKRAALPAADQTGTARAKQDEAPALRLQLFRPGLRVAVAVSGGADSVCLLRLLGNEAQRLGLVLTVAHMHHGIRGDEADQDAAFVAALANQLNLRLLQASVNTPLQAKSARKGLEETARTLRYRWFAELLASGELDAVVTAHTRNDQAETVLQKLLRGAWTEGLGGIHPVVTTLSATSPLPSRAAAHSDPTGAGLILRPLLDATRGQVVAWLEAIGQPWREDSTNADLAYTRNRIRQQLLPELATYNPQVTAQLAQLATLARDDEDYWQREVDRLLPGLLLPGRPVRGGGRSSSTLPGERSLAIEVDRLRGFHLALLRRLLRAAAHQFGVSLDYEQTARLLVLVSDRGATSPRRAELTAELRAERTPRELRLLFTAGRQPTAPGAFAPAAADITAVEIPIPGEGEALGWRIRCSLHALASSQSSCEARLEPAILRPAQPGDRVQLRHSRGAPKRIKEVLERMGIPAPDRTNWPVLTWRGEVLWMRGAALESSPSSSTIRIEAEPLA